VVIVRFVTAPVRLVRRLYKNIGLGSWAPLPVKVKMDGAVVYEFGSVSEQSVHEIVSGIRDAVNRAIDVLILLLIYTKVFIYTQMASVKLTTYKIFTEGQAAGVMEIVTRFDSLMFLFLSDTTYD
jgi:hypothetical protein